MFVSGQKCHSVAETLSSDSFIFFRFIMESDYGRVIHTYVLGRFVIVYLKISGCNRFMRQISQSNGAKFIVYFSCDLV